MLSFQHNLNEILKYIKEPYGFFYTGIDYDTTRKNKRCICNHKFICRCSEIKKVEINSINLQKLIDTTSENLNDIDRYCLDRLIRKSLLTMPSSWKAEIVAGFYGEEIEIIKPVPSAFEYIKQSLIEFSTCNSDKEKIDYVLFFEYGSLLPELQNLNQVSIVSVKCDDIILGAEKHLEKVAEKDLNIYQHYKLPRGIAIKKGNKYRVIDGYHRITHALNNKQPDITIIRLE